MGVNTGKSVTLADVAREVGVHPSTVSRALSRRSLVNARTCERVDAAVERLGYRPNLAARRLVSGRTSTIAVVVPDITNPFFAALVQAAQQRAGDDGQLVLLADSALGSATELHAVHTLAPNVDGIIVCSPVAPVGDLREAARGRAMVFLNRRSRGIPSVIVDQRDIVDLSVEHLRACGHRRIAMVRGPDEYWSSQQRRRRVAQIAPDVVLVDPPEPSFGGGRGVASAVLETGATAVIAFNDVIALGIMHEAERLGVSLPGQLAVVGSDGIPAASMVTPELTTIAAPLAELGGYGVELLLAAIAGVDPASLTLRPRLVVAGTTASAALQGVVQA